MGVQTVKWPGANIHEDITHRLVTDEQIAKWDRISDIYDDGVFWTELTPENIGEYTCTKEDPDGYWTDMGMAEGNIFDSSSLDPGNYIIKLGMDKLCKMNSVSLPHLRVNADCLPSGVLDGTESWNGYKLYTCYLNYGIDPTTLIFLCQFFGVNFSVDYLINNLYNNYNISIKLQSSPQRVTSTSSGDSTTGMYLNDKDNQIYWPECLKIKVMKKEYGPAEDKKYKLVKYVYADMNIVDYYNCANYKIDTDNIPDGEITKDNIANYNLPVIPLTDDEGNQIFIGEPFFHKYIIRDTYVWVTDNIEFKNARKYYKYGNNIMELNEIVPETVYDSIYLYEEPSSRSNTHSQEYGGVTYITGSGITFYKSMLTTNENAEDDLNWIKINGSEFYMYCDSNQLCEIGHKYKSQARLYTDTTTTYGDQIIHFYINIHDNTDNESTINSWFDVSYNRDDHCLEIDGQNAKLTGSLVTHYVKDGDNMNDLTEGGLITFGNGKYKNASNYNIAGYLTDAWEVSNIPIIDGGDNDTCKLVGGYILNTGYSCMQVLYDVKMNQYMRIAYSAIASNEREFVWGDWNKITYSNMSIPTSDTKNLIYAYSTEK